MRLLRPITVAGCILAIHAAAFGQACAPKSQPASAPAVPAKAILEVIPAGSMGFAVVNNARQSLSAMDEYFRQIGVGELIQQSLPGDLLSNLQRGAQLGEGFNPDGGFAAVMLDLQPFGIDLDKLMADESGPPPKLPFVLFVPGSGIQEVFGNYPIDSNASPALVSLRMGDMYAMTMGGYVVLSPVAKALDAVAKAEKRAASELTKEQIDTMGKSEFAVFINMKVAGPLVTKGMDKAIKEMQGEAGAPMPPRMAILQILPMLRDIVGQVDSEVIAAHFTKTAMTLEVQAAFDPNSLMGKAMAAVKPLAQSAMLDRVPNFKYVLAAGGVGDGKEGAKVALDMIDAVIKAMPNVSPETLGKLKTVASGLTEQITQKQFVIGQAPEGSGAIAAACVLQCKDPEKVESLMTDYINTIPALIKDMIPQEDANEAPFKAVFTKGADKLDALAVDVIEITSPKLAELDANDLAQLKALIGEDKLRVLLAVPQPGTLVMTFGGGKAFLAEAVKIAKAGGGTIPTEPEVVDVLKFMPKQATGIVLFNIGNLFELINKSMTAVGKAGEMPPFKLAAKTPLAIGMGASGNTAQATLYVPNKLVREAVQMFLQMTGMGGGMGAEGEEAKPAALPAD